MSYYRKLKLRRKVYLIGALFTSNFAFHLQLALRAGNEKDGDETADTVGCCSLRVEHITLHPEKDGKHYVVEFDFLGKDSIRYLNSIPVEKRVYKNVELFMENKAGEDDLFDRLNVSTALSLSD